MITTWIVAYKNSEFQLWQEYFGADDLATAQNAAKLCADDESRQLVCIFYNRPGWQDKAPKYIIVDRRDKTNWPIHGLGDLINSAPSNYF